MASKNERPKVENTFRYSILCILPGNARISLNACREADPSAGEGDWAWSGKALLRS